MTQTQEVINNLRFDHIIHTPLLYVQHEFQSLSSRQQHTHLLAPTIEFLVFVSILAYIIHKVFIFRNNFKQNAILLEITPPAITQKSAYTTEQLFSVIHNSRSGNRLRNWLFGKKPVFSFEIASTRGSGIKYFIHTNPEQKENMKRKIMSYLPNTKVVEAAEYLLQKNQGENIFSKVIEFTLSSRFAYPLEKQNMLSQHDPVAYITGMMTQLRPNELVSMQIVLSPTKIAEARKIANMILRNEDVLAYLDTYQPSGGMKVLLFSLRTLGFVLNKVGQELQWAISELFHGSTSTAMYNNNFAMQQQYQQQLKMSRIKPVRQLSSFEEELIKSVQAKVDQPLFEATIRVLVSVASKEELQVRLDGLRAAFEPFAVPQYQSLQPKMNFPPIVMQQIRDFVFRKRLLSLVSNKSTSILSVSEVADLYHFPFSSVTQTENIVKLYSKELPAPLSLKQGKQLDVVFAKNTYGGITTEIGLTDEQRATHMYILGRTGSGKTTMMFRMAMEDIQKGRGIAFIDPHGDVAQELLATIPEERINDLVYVNPADLKYPVGINVLELTKGLDDDETELEKETVTEGVVSLFRKVFSKEEHANAHRIEHILRQTIYTAFYVEDATLFTLNKILSNPKFRNDVLKKITDDEELLDFWKYEFGKAGDFQVVKMTQGVTAKVSRFFRSPTARRILEQPKSTINFDEILNGKILICNFSQRIGEDTSRLLGITILTKLQQAALKRANIPEETRRPFYLYVDEFQNFATQSFTKLLAEGRKYGLRLIIAEQSTSQQQDRTIVPVILANVTTIVSFRTGNPIDEDLLLSQFAPFLQKGEIMNLPRFRFYIKITALESEEPFSGETIKEAIVKDQIRIQRLIEASRKNYAIIYVKKIVKKITKAVIKPTFTNDEKTNKEDNGTKEESVTNNRLPKRKKGQ